MKQFSWWISGFAMLCVLAACSGTGPVSSRHAEESALRELNRHELTALNAKDAEAWLALLVDDYVSLEPGHPQRVGKQLQRALLGPFFEKLVAEEREITRIDVAASGDLAYLLGNYRIVMKGDDGLVEGQGKYIQIAKKIDGMWKIAVLSFNGNGP